MPAERKHEEAEFQSRILRACNTHGVLNFHPYDSRRSEPGFPDLVLVGRGGVLFREIKIETGRVATMQKFWLASLTAAGQDAGIWRPSDWPNRILSEIRALGRVTVPRPKMTQAQLRRALQKKAGRSGTR